MGDSDVNMKILMTAREFLEVSKTKELLEYILTKIIIDRPEDVREYINAIYLPEDDKLHQALLDMKIPPAQRALYEQQPTSTSMAAARTTTCSFSPPPVLPPIVPIAQTCEKDEQEEAIAGTEGTIIEVPQEARVETGKNEDHKWSEVVHEKKETIATVALVKRWTDHNHEHHEDGHHGESHNDTSAARLSRKTPQNHGVSNADVLEAIMFHRHKSKMRDSRHHSSLSGVQIERNHNDQDDDDLEFTPSVPHMQNNPDDFEHQTPSATKGKSVSTLSIRASPIANRKIAATTAIQHSNAIPEKTKKADMKMVSAAEVVASIPIFTHCTPEFCKALEKHVHMRLFRFHEQICTKGTDACTMYYICHGAVEVMSDDNELALADLETGNHFGEGAILNQQKRTSTVRAATNTILMSIAKKDLKLVLDEYAENKEILDKEAERLRQFEAKLTGANRLLGEFEESFIAESLKQIPMFHSCNHVFLHELALTVELKLVQKDTKVINKGDVGHAMFFIVRGRANVVDNDAVVATLEGGHFFGEIGVLFDVPRTFDVIANTAMDLIVVEREKLEEVMKGYPSIKKHIEEEATERYDKYQRMHNSKLMFGNAMDLDIVREGLSATHLMHGCEQVFLHAIALTMKPFIFKHHEKIYEAGDQIDKIIFIIEGTVDAADEDEQLISSYKAQQIIGLDEVVLNRNAECTYKATSFGFGMSITREEMEEIMVEYMDDLCLIQERAEAARR